jgi:hypothetical protein
MLNAKFSVMHIKPGKQHGHFPSILLNDDFQRTLSKINSFIQLTEFNKKSISALIKNIPVV